jgi:fatty acid desaturase
LRLRYRKDLSSLACVLVSFSCQVAWLATGQLGFLLPMIAALRWTALVQHNHSHLTLFKRPLANRVLDLAFGPVTGMPMELYREAHARTHHPHMGTPQDWTQPTEVLDGHAVQERPLARGRYLYVFVPRACRLGFAALRHDRSQRRALFVECAAMAALLVPALLGGSPARLGVVVLLWTVVGVVSADANYKHHNGYLAAADPTDHANDSFSPLHTVLGFNIGYHTSHHRRPNAHWSKLPSLAVKAAEPELRQAA